MHFWLQYDSFLKIFFYQKMTCIFKSYFASSRNFNHYLFACQNFAASEKWTSCVHFLAIKDGFNFQAEMIWASF